MQFPYRTCILPVPYIYAYAMLITLPAAWSLASYFYQYPERIPQAGGGNHVERCVGSVAR